MIKQLMQRSGISTNGELMTLREFYSSVKGGAYIDYDGYGHACINSEETELKIWPSLMNDITVELLEEAGVTHINWFNR